MVHILETLQRLESKFDNLQISNTSTPVSNREWPAQNNSRAMSVGDSMGDSVIESNVSHESEGHGEAHTFPLELQRSYKHLTVAHKVLLWPAVYLHILNSGVAAASDLQYVLQDGTPWFINLELTKHPETLPWDTVMETYPIPHPQPQAIRVGFPQLTVDNVQRMTEA